jgi:lipoprotein
MGRIYYLLLAAVCVAMLGCKKERPKREEYLRPEGSLIGEWVKIWEDGHLESRPSTKRVTGSYLILRADSSWKYYEVELGTRQGAKFRSVWDTTGLNRPGVARPHWELELLDGEGAKRESIPYALTDTCLLVIYGARGAVGSFDEFWYLKRR